MNEGGAPIGQFRRSVFDRTMRIGSVLVLLAPVINWFWRFDAERVRWTHDTASFVEFSGARQPLYGLFFNTLRGHGFADSGIACVQVLLLTAAIGAFAYEVYRSRLPGAISLALALLFVFPLNTFVVPYTAALISEGLFLPFVCSLAALGLRYARTQRIWNLLGVAFIGTFVVFVRGAALAFMPATAGTLLLGVVLAKEPTRRDSMWSLLLVCACAVIIPPMLGRAPLDLNAPESRKGFVFLPRVVTVASELPLSEPGRTTWRRLNDSFSNVSGGLSCGERALFESQLQEAVRYSIGPTIMLGGPDVWVSGSVRSESSDLLAFEIFKAGVRSESAAYLQSTGCHFWSLVTAGPLVGNNSRRAVMTALRNVDAETWRLAPFRTDYPLLNFDMPLSMRTSVTYFSVRLFAFFSTAIAVLVTILTLLFAIFRGRRLCQADLVLLLLTACLVAHSLLIALSAYADLRYVAANLILQLTLDVLISIMAGDIWGWGRSGDEVETL